MPGGYSNRRGAVEARLGRKIAKLRKTIKVLEQSLLAEKSKVTALEEKLDLHAADAHLREENAQQQRTIKALQRSLLAQQSKATALEENQIDLLCRLKVSEKEQHAMAQQLDDAAEYVHDVVESIPSSLDTDVLSTTVCTTLPSLRRKRFNDQGVLTDASHTGVNNPCKRPINWKDMHVTCGHESPLSPRKCLIPIIADAVRRMREYYANQGLHSGDPRERGSVTTAQSDDATLTTDQSAGMREDIHPTGSTVPHAHADEVLALHGQVIDLQGHVINLQRENNSLHHHVMDQQEEIKYLSDQLRETLKNDLTACDLRDRNDMLRAERDQVTQEREQVTQERDRVIQERDQVTQERDQVTQERDRVTQERDRVTQERDRVTQERDRFEREAAHFNACVAGANSFIDLLQQELAEAQASCPEASADTEDQSASP